MANPIVVSRGVYDSADLLEIRIEQGGVTGRGECCPVAHYGESVESVSAQITSVADKVAPGSIDRLELLGLLPPGAARNGIDCALWDLECKQSGKTAWEIARVKKPGRQATAMTVNMADPDKMAADAAGLTDFETIKLKLGTDNPEEAMRAVRAVRADARLSLDANESWSREQLKGLLPVIAELDFEMIEQPVKAGTDEQLERLASIVPFCADESFHSSTDLSRASEYYGFINIKLDKCGGLTEALRIMAMAKDYNLRPMVGCMFSTSLAMAPAMIVAAQCEFADLDGPLHLSDDRPGGYSVVGGDYDLNSSTIWG